MIQIFTLLGGHFSLLEVSLSTSLEQCRWPHETPVAKQKLLLFKLGVCSLQGMNHQYLPPLMGGVIPGQPSQEIVNLWEETSLYWKTACQVPWRNNVGGQG